MVVVVFNGIYSLHGIRNVGHVMNGLLWLR
jgi:hypothetical protein